MTHTTYARALQEQVIAAHPDNQVILINGGVQSEAAALLRAFNNLPPYAPGAELYIELDRSIIADIEHDHADGAASLLPHLLPVLMRIDKEGDVIIHVTTNERVMFHSEVIEDV